MDDNAEQEALEKNRILQAKLNLAVQQRNGFITNYHTVMRMPFKERSEIIDDCNQDLEKLDHGNPK